MDAPRPGPAHKVVVMTGCRPQTRAFTKKNCGAKQNLPFTSSSAEANTLLTRIAIHEGGEIFRGEYPVFPTGEDDAIR